MWHLSSR